jgi:hypothetical protein
VVGTPLPSAVAADCAILRINHELPFSALATAPLLTGPIGTYGLPRMKSGWFELFPAETAAALIHPFKVTVPFIGSGIDIAACSVRVRLRPSKLCQRTVALRNLTWRKGTTALRTGSAIDRLAG